MTAFVAEVAAALRGYPESECVVVYLNPPPGEYGVFLFDTLEGAVKLSSLPLLSNRVAIYVRDGVDLALATSRGMLVNVLVGL